MKKLIALVFAVIMLLVLSTPVSAFTLDAQLNKKDGASTEIGTSELFYGESGKEGTDKVEFFLETYGYYVPAPSILDRYLLVYEAPEHCTFCHTPRGFWKDLMKTTVSATSNRKDVKVTVKEYLSALYRGIAFKIIVEAAPEKFTLAGPSNYEIDIRVNQAFLDFTDVDGNFVPAGSINGTTKVIGTIQNSRSYLKNSYTDASGKYIIDKAGRVIDAAVFKAAATNNAGLTVNYEKYSVNFERVSKQDDSLYLYAKTGIITDKKTKAIASIEFSPMKIKDAATITMPVSADDVNSYGDTVYVYKLVNGKPTGKAKEVKLVNHNEVMFTVPAGTTLGAYAAYGAKV